MILWKGRTRFRSTDDERGVARNVVASLSLYLKGEEGMNNKFPYVIGQRAAIFHDGKWNEGKIVEGYRFRDGIVTILTDDGRKL